MFSALPQVRGGGEEWQVCQFNLYAPRSGLSPQAPSFESVVPGID